MRNHPARVVLGACLIAAAAAAQAPASLFSSRQLGLDAPDRRELAVSPSLPQDQVDYSLLGQFRLHHGEFMDRRERFTPQIDLRGRILPNQRINDEPGSFDLFGYDLDAEFPILITTEAYITVGAYYHGRRYLFSSAFGTAGNGPGNGIPDETLFGAGVKLGFGWFLDENMLLEVETHPGVWSDGDDGLHGDDYDFPSFGLFTLRAVDNFFFKFGARYNQVYEEAPWLPMLGFSWEIVDGFRLDLLAPESLEVSYWPDSSLGFLFGANVTGAEYHVRTDEASGSQRDDLQVQEVVAYLGLISRLNDYVSFGLRAGLVIAGDYDLTTGAAGFDRSEGALDQGFYAEASFGISF